jgi:hypothetical protein
MSQENKKLLLQDLCGRIPYGVKMNHIANTENNPITLVGVAKTMITLESSAGYGTSDIEDYIPYLFPLSSMTEEQKKEFKEISKCEYEIKNCGGFDSEGIYLIEIGKYEYEYDIDTTIEEFYFNYKIINWLNKNHFDYRGLIEKGLAIDCTNLNIY